MGNLFAAGKLQGILWRSVGKARIRWFDGCSRVVLVVACGFLLLRSPICRGRDTSLHVAAATGDVCALTDILDEGAWIDVRNRWGETALHLAAWGGHLDAVRLLVDRGAKTEVISDTDSDAHARLLGATPLHYAIHSGVDEVVEFLVSRGVDVDAPGQDGGRSPLAITTGWGSVRMAKALVEAGADCRKSNPVFTGAVSGNAEVLEFLLSTCNADPNDRGGYGGTALGAAIHHRHLRTVQVLLEHDADPEIVCGHEYEWTGFRPLHVAACIGDVQIAECLLRAGASPSAIVEDVMTTRTAWEFHSRYVGMKAARDRASQWPPGPGDHAGELVPAIRGRNSPTGRPTH